MKTRQKKAPRHKGGAPSPGGVKPPGVLKVLRYYGILTFHVTL